jgi:hypothetical protein
MFEYTTTCPLVAQEVFAAGFVALVAVGIGSTVERRPTLRRMRLSLFFILPLNNEP